MCQCQEIVKATQCSNCAVENVNLSSMAPLELFLLILLICQSTATYYSWDPYAIIGNQITKKLATKAKTTIEPINKSAIVNLLSRGLSPSDLLCKIPYGM